MSQLLAGSAARPRPGSASVATPLSDRFAVDMAGRGDGFEARVNAERCKEATDVVPDRLRAQVELSGDLLRGASLLQKA